MHKKSFGIFSFIATVIIMVAVLMIINWLPMAIQKETMRRYSSIDKVRSGLNIKEIYVPSYFPQNLRWPPSEILAQTKPFTAVIMEFRHAERGDVVLIISQSASKDFTPDKKIKITRIKERVGYSLKDRNALLEAGVCKDDNPCTRISWKEGKYNMNVIMKSPPFDLIKVAESMIH